MGNRDAGRLQTEMEVEVSGAAFSTTAAATTAAIAATFGVAVSGALMVLGTAAVDARAVVVRSVRPDRQPPHNSHRSLHVKGGWGPIGQKRPITQAWPEID